MDELVQRLQDEENIYIQADILNHLHNTWYLISLSLSIYVSHLHTHTLSLPPSGRSYQLEVRGKVCSLSSLLEELYQKSGTLHLWSLIRHMAGLLEKTVEDLGTVCTACYTHLILIRAPLPCRQPLICWLGKRTFQLDNQTMRLSSPSETLVWLLT